MRREKRKRKEKEKRERVIYSSHFFFKNWKVSNLFLQISITLEGFEIIFADVLLSIISLFLLNMASSTSEPTKITSILLFMHKLIMMYYA